MEFAKKLLVMIGRVLLLFCDSLGESFHIAERERFHMG